MSKKRQAETTASLEETNPFILAMKDVPLCPSATNATAPQSVASIATSLDAPIPNAVGMPTPSSGLDNANAENAAITLTMTIPAAPSPYTIPTTINEPTLPSLAKQINTAFADVDTATLTLTDKRLEAGTLLKMAHDRMPERGAFMIWCKANVKRGKSDIYRCLALVKSDDPVAAHEAVKAADRERKAAAKPAATVPEKDNSGTKALAAIIASKPAPSNRVWSEPASQTRDKTISMQATALASLKSYALADATVTQIRLLRGNDWASIPSARRLIVIDEIRKLIVELEPKE